MTMKERSFKLSFTLTLLFGLLLALLIGNSWKILRKLLDLLNSWFCVKYFSL
nr:MAG TPA: hypothetical protein [Caudoviricetes sp.]